MQKYLSIKKIIRGTGERKIPTAIANDRNRSNRMGKRNALCKTPPMGWNSWNTFGEEFNEKS